MTTDTALAIAMLPRLRRAGIATDLRVGFENAWLLDTGEGSRTELTNSQAVAYIVGCVMQAIHNEGNTSPLSKCEDWFEHECMMGRRWNINKEPA